MDDGSVSVRLRDYADMEPLLANLRESGAVIRELEVSPPALEDVFRRVMAPIMMRPESPVSPMTGCVGLLKKETLRFWRVAFQTIGAPRADHPAVSDGVLPHSRRKSPRFSGCELC